MANAINSSPPCKAKVREDWKSPDFLHPDQHSPKHARSLSTSTVFSKRPSSTSSTGVRRRHSFRSTGDFVKHLPPAETHEHLRLPPSSEKRREVLSHLEGTDHASAASLPDCAKDSSHVSSEGFPTVDNRPVLKKAASDSSVVFKRSLEVLDAGAYYEVQEHNETYTPGLGAPASSVGTIAVSNFLGYAGRFSESQIDPILIGLGEGSGATELREVGARFICVLEEGTPEFTQVCSQEYVAALEEDRLPAIIKTARSIQEQTPTSSKPHEARRILQSSSTLIGPSSCPNEEVQNTDQQATVRTAQINNAPDRTADSDPQSDANATLTPHENTDAPQNDRASDDTTPSSVELRQVTQTTAFICPTHKKSFQKRTDLERHYRSKKLHPESACEYRCPACPKKFSANVDNRGRHLKDQHNWDKDRRNALISRIRPKGRNTS